jgi:hypothetical protein
MFPKRRHFIFTRRGTTQKKIIFESLTPPLCCSLPWQITGIIPQLTSQQHTCSLSKFTVTSHSTTHMTFAEVVSVSVDKLLIKIHKYTNKNGEWRQQQKAKWRGRSRTKIKIAVGVLHDAEHKLYKSVLYYQNVMQINNHRCNNTLNTHKFWSAYTKFHQN